MLSFIAALYNEETEVESLLESVEGFVDGIYLSDDGSTDNTDNLAHRFALEYLGSDFPFIYSYMAHTGRPEVVKANALELVPPNEWVLMLDADERMTNDTLGRIRDFIRSPEASHITHVWFTLEEFIDDIHTKTFQKCRLFKKEAAHFSTSIHEDDRFDGQGVFFGWKVIHRKTAEKQVEREIQYLQTYTEMLSKGEIDADRFNWLVGNHYFIRPHG